MSKGLKYGIVLAILMAVLFVANLFVGSVRIPPSEVLNILSGSSSKESWKFIMFESRLPQALTALLCGASLSVCGLMLQTIFRNPLAGPSILGINAGANLGVAVVMLLLGGSITSGVLNLSGFLSVLIAAFAGAMAVMALILFFSTIVRSNLMLLIIGMMIGYVTSSFISLLNFFSTAEGVKSYMVWGMGNFGGVSLAQMPAFSAVVLLGLAGALMLIKPLNALLLGDRYAENLGINIKAVRNWLLVITGLLTAITTAFCGPIAFIGLAVPHVARMVLGTSNHRSLMPVTILCGAVTALICNLICVLPTGAGIIPLNAVTPLLGAPIIIYVIIRGRRQGSV